MITAYKLKYFLKANDFQFKIKDTNSWSVTPTKQEKKHLENAKLMTFPEPIGELRPQVKQQAEI